MEHDLGERLPLGLLERQAPGGLGLLEGLEKPGEAEELERIVYRCITVPTYGLDELKTDLEAFISKA